MKDIKKMLTDDGAKILPDDNRIKQNVKRELGIDRAQPVLACAHGGEKAVDSSKNRTFLVLGAVCLALILFLGIFLPFVLNKKPVKGGFTVNKFAQITDTDSFYAYGAASVGTLLSSVHAQQTAVSDPAAEAMAAKPRTAQFRTADAQKIPVGLDTVNRYMKLVESLLSEGTIASSAIAGDRDYEFGITVRYTDLIGNGVSYRMYYNKRFTQSEEKDGEREEVYDIDGILLVGENEYPVEGSGETETEDGERESELRFKAYTNADKTDYIEVRQETETDLEETEQTYVYSAYRDGELLEETRVEYQSENGELELELSITAGDETDRLTFKNDTKDGSGALRVNGRLDGQSVSFSVRIRRGEYHYVFDDGSSSDLDRDDGDDDFDD